MKAGTDDTANLALLFLAAFSIAAIVLLREWTKPLPLHRRIWVAVMRRQRD